MTDESKIRDASDAARGIIEAVPVYQDVVQPAARELGAALQTVAKTIHIALAPISALVWGYDQIRDFVSTKVAQKLQGVPPESIRTPLPNVAGPALEALKYTGHQEDLREMYANLLAASMDAVTAAGVHPAFVDVIRQLTPDEARILRLMADRRPFPLLTVRWEYKVSTPERRGGQDVLGHFSLLGSEAGCEFPDATPSYLGNLSRLGLIELPPMFQYTAPGVYEPLEQHPQVQAMVRTIEEDPEVKPVIQREGLRVTEFGRQFVRVCVVPHDEAPGTPAAT